MLWFPAFVCGRPILVQKLLQTPQQRQSDTDIARKSTHDELAERICLLKSIKLFARRCGGHTDVRHDHAISKNGRTANYPRHDDLPELDVLVDAFTRLPYGKRGSR